MSLAEQIDKLEVLLNKGKVPASKRALIDLESAQKLLAEMRDNLPTVVSDANTVIRQRDAIIQEAQSEARRIREYADKEATAIRNMAEEQSSQRVATARKEASGIVDETSIITQAHEEADSLVKDAQARSDKIVAQGREQANQILQEIEQEANDRRGGADKYAREVLFGLEERIVETLSEVRSGLDLLDTRGRPSAG